MGNLKNDINELINEAELLKAYLFLPPCDENIYFTSHLRYRTLRGGALNTSPTGVQGKR